MNPYRDAFYQRQAEWHGYTNPEFAKAKHEQRIPYYAWYTRGWLPENRATAILDVGCGSGQLLYFLRSQGYEHTVGLDLDGAQVEVARGLGLNAVRSTVTDFLADDRKDYGLIAMLDILEHFTREELYPITDSGASR